MVSRCSRFVSQTCYKAKPGMVQRNVSQSAAPRERFNASYFSSITENFIELNFYNCIFFQHREQQARHRKVGTGARIESTRLEIGVKFEQIALVSLGVL
jgi:hypothetical protein